MKSKRKWFLTLVFAVPLVIIFSQCLTSTSGKPDPRGDIFAGSATCIQCHKNNYDSYIHTAHFSSTRPASESTMMGDFNKGSNVFYFDKDLKVVMEKHGNDLYQVAYFKGKKAREEKFDIVFGGVKSESYLYWKGNSTYQLPLSYFKALHSWTNSPGFDTAHANFDRGIGRRCFECHASYIKPLPNNSTSLKQTVELDKTSLVMGIDCERCHGPAANHANFHLAYPDVKEPKFIKTYASLTRSQKIDMCATCHSGNGDHMLRTTFVFKPGDKLADFKEVTFHVPHVDSAKMDVHGNQSQLLASSKCFLMSKMDCATCHNVHKSEKDLNLALYSAKCITCHSSTSHNECKMTATLGAMIKNNCIDCHMPAKPSNVISVQTNYNGRAIPYLVRTHHIAVYKDVSTTVKNDLKKYNLAQTAN